MINHTFVLMYIISNLYNLPNNLIIFNLNFFDKFVWIYSNDVAFNFKEGCKFQRALSQMTQR